ncbi:MAG TPA: fatty acid desaturase [Candidatus Eisenbacteria bacterium]|jgi:stearoyl-CoA desaturase (delta-9 desaturase)|nr:fatty acid desaturase [Candidatus Eisenbacteria bacterium]
MAGRGKVRWAGVAFLVSTAFAGFVLAPVYFWSRGGVPAFQIGLFLFYAFATMMAITVGYHRLYAHRAFRAHPAVEWFVLIFGAAAFEQSALRWASLHRTHHKFTDTERDPYNITRGFLYAHMGWIVLDKPSVDYENSDDLRKNPRVASQHKNHQRWGLAVGVILPAALGAATGDFVGALLLAVAARLAIVHHGTFFINSFAHTFGSSEYDADSTAKDNWLGAVLTNGEGYHNYHHRFPSDYRNGVRWFHWDPTKWMIWILSRTGLAMDLNRTPEARISEAKAAASDLKARRAVLSAA